MACAAVLALSLVGHVVVFAMVHFTDARLVETGEAEGARTLKVVRSTGDATDATPSNPQDIASAPSRAEVNRVPGEGDVFVRRVSMVVQGAGILSALMLSALMFQGVVVAGGGAVPGVERAVSACTLCMVVVLMCVPLHRFLPELQYQGVFVSYASLVEQSAAVRAGGGTGGSALSFHVAHLLMPAGLLAGLIMSVVRFRSGIEAGVIATSVSEIDEKLEREIRAMKTGQLASPRAMGALNMALGAAPADTMPREAVGAEVVRAAPPAFRGAGDQSPLTFNPGDSTKRPI